MDHLDTFTSFLQWSLPKLGLNFDSFTKVQKCVYKNIHIRLRELQIKNLSTYKSYLESHNDEWLILDSIYRLHVSKFYRDKKTFQYLEEHILPLLRDELISKKETEMIIWSIGCAAGQEAYTLYMIWDTCCKKIFSTMKVNIFAIDIDPEQIKRAKDGCFKESELKELPHSYRCKYFLTPTEVDIARLHKDVIESVHFITSDIRKDLPLGKVHLILCCNLVYSYFNNNLQEIITKKFQDQLVPGGFLVIGRNEKLPSTFNALKQIQNNLEIYRKLH